MYKKIFPLVFISLLACSASAEIVRGKNGNNVFWNFNTETKVFSLFGDGRRWTSDSTQVLPWYDYLGQIESIQISHEVRYLGDWAFAGCPRLMKVNIPEKLADVGMAPFWNCPNLKDPLYNDSVFIYYPPSNPDPLYILPVGPKYIAGGAFFGCSNLEQVKLTETYLFLDPFAFAHCTNLTTISYIKCHPVWIGEGCFQECQNLKNFKFADGLMEIGDAAFMGCVSLTTVALPLGFTKIGKKAFSLCSNLTAVHLPATITHIDDGAFTYCDGIKIVNIPNKNCKMGKGVFPYQTKVTWKKK